jgi:hypothetical protein
VKALGGMWLGAACIALFLAPSAQAAHKLTAKKAEAALRPAAEQMTPEVAQKIAALLPGATISKTGVKCQIAKKKQLADCNIEFSIAGASTGETMCARPARVKFRSKTSKELKVSTAPVLACFFLVPLE